MIRASRSKDKETMENLEKRITELEDETKEAAASLDFLMAEIEHELYAAERRKRELMLRLPLEDLIGLGMEW